MILYCDTSALIKRYVEEEGTGLVDDLWEKSKGIATSVVAFAESLSAFSRRHREGLLSGREYHTVVEKFKTDYGFFILVPIDDALNHKIETIIKKHPLRGFDAIHLASALRFTKLENNGLKFACFDRNLNEAARKEGLNTAED